MPEYIREIPGFIDKSIGEWGVSQDLSAASQCSRVLVKIGTYLFGDGPADLDKGQLRREAGRVLLALLQETREPNFLEGSDEKHRSYIIAEANRIWSEEGGLKAKDDYFENNRQNNESPSVEEEADVVPSTDNLESLTEKENVAEKILDNLTDKIKNFARFCDFANKILGSACESMKIKFSDTMRYRQMVSIKNDISSLDPEKISADLLQKIEETNLGLKNEPRNTGHPEFFGLTSDEQLKIRAVREIYSDYMKLVLNKLNNLYAATMVEQNNEVKVIVSSAINDIEKMLKLIAGIEKIDIVQGAAIDYDTMFARVDSPEDTTDQRYSEGHFVAKVLSNGYQFEDDLRLFGGEGGDILKEAHVSVFNYVGK